jgi:hypothetical protein
MNGIIGLVLSFFLITFSQIEATSKQLVTEIMSMAGVQMNGPHPWDIAVRN